MGRYRKVDTRIWNDAGFGSLSDDGKLAFLLVLTHPHMTSLGAMRATVAGLAAELGWPLERFQRAFKELTTGETDCALVEHDEQASFIGFRNFLKYNAPENPNVVTSWGSLLDLLPECAAKSRLITRVEQCVADRGENFLAAWETVSETVCPTVPERLPEPARNRMPNPEQEPDPEQKPDKRE